LLPESPSRAFKFAARRTRYFSTVKSIRDGMTPTKVPNQRTSRRAETSTRLVKLVAAADIPTFVCNMQSKHSGAITWALCDPFLENVGLTESLPRTKTPILRASESGHRSEPIRFKIISLGTPDFPRAADIRAAARHLMCSNWRANGIAPWADCVVIESIPIPYPLFDQSCGIANAKSIGRVPAHDRRRSS
jgi:hypothetical protein